MQHGLSGTDTSCLSNCAATDVFKVHFNVPVLFRESSVVADVGGSSGGGSTEFLI
jgi:hypothetical protein